MAGAKLAVFRPIFFLCQGPPQPHDQQRDSSVLRGSPENRQGGGAGAAMARPEKRTENCSRPKESVRQRGGKNKVRPLPSGLPKVTDRIVAKVEPAQPRRFAGHQDCATDE